MDGLEVIQTTTSRAGETTGTGTRTGLLWTATGRRRRPSPRLLSSGRSDGASRPGRRGRRRAGGVSPPARGFCKRLQRLHVYKAVFTERSSWFRRFTGDEGVNVRKFTSPGLNRWRGWPQRGARGAEGTRTGWGWTADKRVCGLSTGMGREILFLKYLEVTAGRIGLCRSAT